MELLKALEIENTISNSKGGRYYESSYNNNNLDLFCATSRYQNQGEIASKFSAAFNEDKILATANLLHILDIRGGKGERRIFKICFKKLISLDKELALKVLSLIPDLGRYDYILEGINTPIEEDVVSLIKTQLAKDNESETPSLLGKWLPSLRTHNVNNMLAKKLVKLLDMSEKDYRKMLSSLRNKINIVEKNLTERSYNKINFEQVPSKAMLKYKDCFALNMKAKYKEYLSALTNKEAKVNTKGLFAYEIIDKVTNSSKKDVLLDEMWKNQKDVLNGLDKNILVVADTSGSMTWPSNIPYSTSLGLAIYTAERNKGVFKDKFITFSSNPRLQTIKGDSIFEKVKSIKTIVASTNIDKVFTLLLDTLKEHECKEDELPSHILIISDMEFDKGVYSKNKTNFSAWKEMFEKNGYKLPTIIFWNVATDIKGIPVTKYYNDVIMVSGFSTNLLENIFSLENYSPIKAMLEVLDKYLMMLK